jgi:hypothetical protein
MCPQKSAEEKSTDGGCLTSYSRGAVSMRQPFFLANTLDNPFNGDYPKKSIWDKEEHEIDGKEIADGQ